MTATHAAQLVDDYLRRLEIALTDVPEDKRDEILDGIRGHILDERGRIPAESDADVMNILDRLGDPGEIAAEARPDGDTRRTPVESSHFGTLEVLALALMILAWPAGIVLLWVSGSWTRGEKLIGTVLPPGGYPGVLLVMSTFRWFVAMADPAPSWVHVTVGAVLFTISLLLIAAPIGTCVYLATRLRLPRTR